MCGECPVWDRRRKRAKSYNCVCFLFAHFSDRLLYHDRTFVLIYDFILHILRLLLRFTIFRLFLFTSPLFFLFCCLHVKSQRYEESKKKKISWWWNINRSKKFNYINSLFLDFSVNYFLWFFQFHFSFRINFESWKFVCKITFEKPRRRSGRGQGKMENINSKEVLIWYRSVALYMCALRLLCNVKCGTGAIWRWLEGWCGGGERSFSRGGQMMGFMYVFLFYFGCLHKCEFHRCVRRRVCVCDFP